ncbi:MAG TPA: hypothetical protein VNQ80_16355 [Parapedobacter sp.]|uniref:hypothetical protein n=1 Tax=Parapedobacter sp. TaxID=1958893 RepID=UPI002BA13570|nr:hypothetical protein [Parapedobacter sp.]HWK58919.1 hypothetical protein [Parapedobacter sp.]
MSLIVILSAHFPCSDQQLGYQSAKSVSTGKTMVVIKPLIVVVICLMLSGCSFLSQLFIQNRSKTKSIFVTVTYQIPAAEFAVKADHMEYVQRICNPKQYRDEEPKKSLKITHRSDSTMSFFIPPSSTAKIESTANMAYVSHIRHISYAGKHIPIRDFIDAAKKHRFDYVYRID